jgi:hypothetical protein
MMNRILLLVLAFLASPAAAQMTASPCYTQSTVFKCYPTTGMYLDGNRSVRFGETTANGSNYVEVKAPTSLSSNYVMTLPAATDTFVGLATSDVLTNKTINGSSNTLTVLAASQLSGQAPLANGGTNKNMTAVAGGAVYTDADSMEVTAAGSSGQYFKSNGASAPTWSAIDISTSSVTGVLPLANGGTNKNMTAVNGGVVWTDSNSQEVSAAGTANQVLISNGAAAPSFALIANANVDSAAAIAGTKINAATASVQGAVNNQDSGSFTATFTQTGGFSQAVTVKWRLVNNTVTLAIPAFAGTATAASAITASGAVPSGIRPATGRPQVVVFVRDNAAFSNVPGYLYVNSSGDIQVGRDWNTGNFTSGASAGLGNTSPNSISMITYILD